MKNTLKIFEGTKVCWVGINDEEIVQMNEILISNGGTVTTLDDPQCTHVVSTRNTVYTFSFINNVSIPGDRFSRCHHTPRTNSQQSCFSRSQMVLGFNTNGHLCQ